MAGDVYFSKVLLLLPMNGSNGATTFTDYSPSPITMIANGNAQISTAQSQWNGSSGLFDGTTDFLSVADSSPFFLTSGNFAVEFWIRAGAANHVVMSTRSGSTQGWTIIAKPGTEIKWQQWDSSNYGEIITGPSIPVNTFAYCKVNRIDNLVTCAVNGVSGSSLNSARRPGTSGSVFQIGAEGIAPSTANLNGHLQDVRITVGYGRPNSTVPTAAFPTYLEPAMIANRRVQQPRMQVFNPTIFNG